MEIGTTLTPAIGNIMYSITNVIIGVPITQELSDLVGQWEADGNPRWREWEDLGFETFYHGAAPSTVGFCGVHLGEFDENSGYIKVEPGALLYYDGHKRPLKISLTPTQKQQDEARRRVHKIDSELFDLCPSFGIYFVNGTS